MVSDKVFDMALDNAKKLGQCLGAMMWIIRHGKLSNDDWRSLSRTWISVADKTPFSEDDFAYIRKEAIRRGVDIG